MVEPLVLYLFGPARVEKDGVQLRFETRKALALLAYLVVTAQPQARDSLAALFWPENDQTGARGALRRTLSVLKTNLPPEFLIVKREQIGISPTAQFTCDVTQFQGLLQTVKKHTHSQALQCPDCTKWLIAAADLYRGGFLSGFTLRDSPAFDDWQYFETDRLRSEFSTALEQLTLIHSGNGEYDKAISYAQRWLALDPLREEAYQQLMLCFLWAGNRNAALLEYRKCVRSLEHELGVPPLEETTQLYHAILEGKIPAPPPLLEKTSGSRVRPSAPEESQATVLEEIPNPRSLVFPLVGRSRETETLLRLYHKRAEQGWFVTIQGEPGIGKTRLAEEFLAYTRQLGAYVVAARCFAGESSLAYAPFTDALMEARRLQAYPERLRKIPVSYLLQAGKLDPEISKEIGDSQAEPAAGIAAAETLFHEGLRQVFFKLLQGNLPGVLFLDDFHNADAASILQLSYMVHRISGNPLLILIAVSNEALSDPLNLLINECQRLGTGSILKLNRLLPNDLNEIVRSVVDPSDKTSQELALRVYQETEGLPFFVVEYFQSFLTNQTNPERDQRSSQLEWPMPGSVQTLLETRLNGLDEMTWQILTTAAIIGRSFEFQVLLEASGRSESETLNGLDRLLARRLIEEVSSSVDRPIDTFDFTHEKIREFIYQQTNPTRRRLVHKRIADTLIRLQRGKNQPAAVSRQIAWHYRQAGLEQESAEQYRAAGDYARSLFANREAIQQYQTALALGYPLPAELHEAVGDLEVWLGEFKQAITSYIAAAALADDSNQARLEHKLGCVYHRRGERELATRYFQTAAERSEARLDSEELASIYADWSLTSYREGRIDEAKYFARQAYALLKDTQSYQLIAKASNILGILARSSGDAISARGWFENSLTTARAHQDYSTEIAASNNLALIFADEQKNNEAIEIVRSALVLCQKIGDRHHEAALLNHLAELFHSNHQEELAMEQLKKAVQIFAEIGGTEEVQTPEIWMLSEW